MKNIKNIFLLFFLGLGVLGMITYTSCTKQDQCSGIVCENGGVCEDGVCVCPFEFEDPNCTTESYSKFIAKFSVTDNCPVMDDSSDRKYTYTIDILEGGNNKEVFIYNFADASSEPNYAIQAILIGRNELLIPKQELPNGKTYSGDIQFEENGKYSASFKIVQDDNVLEGCNSTLTKE